MIDSHCHLYEAEDVEAWLGRFKAAGGEALVCAGAGIESSKQAISLAEKYPEVWATIGIHPESQLLVDSSWFIENAGHPKVVAIGECGLDYYQGIGEQDKREQGKLFEFNVDLARETGLPLVVHCRNAFADLYEILKPQIPNLKSQVMMHCWTGSWDWAEKFLDLGAYISFGGVVTFKNSRGLRDVAKVVPEERVLVETDAPYLAPEPVRGVKNEPANVKYVVARLAEVRGVREEKMARITSENARRLFTKIL